MLVGIPPPNAAIVPKSCTTANGADKLIEILRLHRIDAEFAMMDLIFLRRRGLPILWLAVALLVACSARAYAQPVSMKRTETGRLVAAEPFRGIGLRLDRESAETASALNLLHQASPIFSAEALLHLLDEDRIADAENKTALLVDAYRRSSSVRPTYPLDCFACAQGSVEFAITLASQRDRNELALKVTIISRLQDIHPQAALAFTEELGRDGSFRDKWVTQPGTPLFPRTREIASRIAAILMKNRDLLVLEKDFHAHIFATCQDMPPLLRMRTFGQILLLSRTLPESTAANLRSAIVSDLRQVDFDTLRREDGDLSLIKMLESVSDMYANDASFPASWAATYSGLLFTDAGHEKCTETPASSGGGKEGVDASASENIAKVDPGGGETDLASYFATKIARPLGMAIPAKERFDAIRGCFAERPAFTQELIEMPEGVSGVLRPLYAYKDAIYSPGITPEIQESRVDADSAVSRFIAAMDSYLPHRGESSRRAFLSQAAAFMLLASVLSDDVWFPGAWDAYVEFLDRNDRWDGEEFLWLSQTFPVVTLTSHSEEAEDRLLRRARSKGLVPSFTPLKAKRSEAIGALKRARGGNLRLLGAIQELAPMRYTVPASMRSRLEQ